MFEKQNGGKKISKAAATRQRKIFVWFFIAKGWHVEEDSVLTLAFKEDILFLPSPIPMSRGLVYL